MAHRRYGPNRHSVGALFGNPTNFRFSWYGENERISFESNHIPAGFLQDINDNNNNNLANNLLEAAGITDNVQSYSKSAIFNLLGSGTTTAASLIDQLATQLPNGNTSTNYTQLKNSYGY